MSKIYDYMIISTALVFLLKFAGIPTGADALINFLGLGDGTTAGYVTSAFYVEILAVFALGVAGVIIGFFTTTKTESFLVSTFASAIFTIIASTFVSIVNYTADMGFIHYIVWMIFIPYLAGFGIAIIEFWRGTP